MNSGSQYMNNHGQSLSRGPGQFKYDPKLSVAFFGFGYFLSFCGDTAYKQIKKYIQE
jgi:REP element-mobilizing transposase RayT